MLVFGVIRGKKAVRAAPMWNRAGLTVAERDRDIFLAR